MCVCVCAVSAGRVHVYAHTHEYYSHARLHAYPSTVYSRTNTHERGARGLGVSQRAPLIRVPASRSHNLRPTSPPARPVGPVARRAAAARVYYPRAHTHTETRARTLTGCTRRQIITRVFSLSPPTAAARGGLRFSKLIYYDRPKTAAQHVKCGEIATLLKLSFLYGTRRRREKLSRQDVIAKRRSDFFLVRFIRFRYIAPYKPRARRRRRRRFL